MDPAAGIGMVGRENELARLGELVTAVAAGRGGLGWVRGEPGIGKSALVDAMVTRAAASGCSVFRGVGDELAQAFPLRLMADCLGVSERSADERRARLARLLRGQVNGSGAVDPVLAASERILELVDRLCAEGPVVLVADDLQWADEPSLLVWNRLARAVDQIPLLLVGTSRPLPYRAVAAALWELVRERGGQALELGPLSDADVQRVAARIAGAVPGPLLRGELERAGGNPLYVGELVDALIRDGLVEVTGGVAEFRGDSGATPGSLTMAIGRRLRFPTAGTASVLRMAALLGSDVDLGELAIVSGRPVAALAGVAEEAITTGVIRAAGERLTFRHELIRQVLVEQISPAMRAWLHGHIARELAAAGNGMEVVARHLLAMPHIGDRWVSQWLSEVPESAMYAVPQVSAELLNRALSLIGVDDPRWEAMAARTAQVLFWLGRDEQAGRTAREVARHSTDPGLAARMNILVLRSAGRMGRREDVLPVATAPVDERVPLEYQARLGAWSAVIRAGVGQTAGARAAARTALSQGRRAGDPLAIGYALHAMTLVSDASSALSHIDEALAGLGDDPESMDLRLLLLNNRLTYLAVLGQWEEAENTLAPALVLAERAGTFRAAGLLATAAEVCYLRGGWDDALVHLAGVEPEFLGNRSNLNPPALGALIALHREERDTADAFLRAAGAPRPSAEAYAQAPANWRLTAAWALREEAVGDLRRALDLMATWLDPVPLGGQGTRQELMPHVVRLALEVGDAATASAAVAAAEADAAADPLAGRVTAALCCRAQLDNDTGGLLAAAEDYRRYGWPLQFAFALEEAAVRLAGAGDATRARSAFTDALNSYFGLGATWDLRRTEARLRRYGIRRGPRSLRRRASSGWESLTRSEARIAGLVAQGRSNPDIATELFVSRRTVQTHVSNILVKLEMRSRVDVVREFATRAGGAP